LPTCYAIDLVRLVTSAVLAQRENGLTIDANSAATAVLEGYSQSLEAGGKPFILEECHPGLREMARVTRPISGPSSPMYPP
jgi:uncharacterized protein (DUF2252 family)